MMRRVLLASAAIVAGVLAALHLRSTSSGGVASETAESPRVGSPGSGDATARGPGSSRPQPAPGTPERRAGDLRFDPRTPEYDPFVLFSVLERQPSEIFAGEPRDDRWASVRESFVGDRLARDLEIMMPGAEVVAAECRTSSCRLEIRVGDAAAARTFEVMQKPVLGDVVSPEIVSSADGVTTLSLHVLYRREHRDHDGFRSWYEPLRKGTLDFLRSEGERVPDE